MEETLQENGPTQEAIFLEESTSQQPVNTGPKRWGTCICQENKDEQHEFFEDTTEVFIGRNTKCAIRRQENTVSGTHCRIYRKPDGTVLLEDLSTNGTFIGHAKVGKGNSLPLKNADVIWLIPESQKGKYAPISYRFYVDDVKEEFVGSYKVGRELGSGAFAVVKLGSHRSTGHQVAIKIIDKKQFALANASARNGILDEVAILKKLEHPHIIKVLDVIDAETSLYIVLELVNGGDLFDEIIRCTKFSEDRARSVMHQMVDALMYLHSQNIVHRDLKPENILLTNPAEKGADDIKIADFGLARLVGNASFMKTLCGTPQYLAPEVVTQNVTGGYGKPVDIWSVGVILYVMLSGQAPFSDNENQNILEQVKSGRVPFPKDVWTLITPAARDLVERMLVVDSSKRITLKQIVDHPWMKVGAPKKAMELKVPVPTPPAARKRKNEVNNQSPPEVAVVPEDGQKKARVNAKHGKVADEEKHGPGKAKKKPSYLDEDSNGADDISAKDETMPQAPSKINVVIGQ